VTRDCRVLRVCREKRDSPEDLVVTDCPVRKVASVCLERQVPKVEMERRESQVYQVSTVLLDKTGHQEDRVRRDPRGSQDSPVYPAEVSQDRKVAMDLQVNPVETAKRETKERLGPGESQETTSMESQDCLDLKGPKEPREEPDWMACPA